MVSFQSRGVIDEDWDADIDSQEKKGRTGLIHTGKKPDLSPAVRLRSHIFQPHANVGLCDSGTCD